MRISQEMVLIMLFSFPVGPSVCASSGIQPDSNSDNQKTITHSDVDRNIIKQFDRAIEFENIQVFSDAIRAGWNIDIADPEYDGMTPLMKAAKSGAVQISQLLIVSGADINAKTNSGVTVLMLAAAGGSSELVDELIHHGAEILARDNSGKTALYWAAEWGNTEIIQLLIENGSDINQADSDGISPIMIAANSLNPSSYFYLIQRGADPTLTAKNGTNALCILLKGSIHHVAIFEDLMQRGIDVNAADQESGDTPLIMAVRFRGLSGFINPLIHSGANINHANQVGETPLMEAISHQRDLDIIKVLLDRGADINLQDTTGRNALAVAVEKGTLDTVRILVDAGASINDNQRQILLHLVQQREQGPERTKIRYYLNKCNRK